MLICKAFTSRRQSSHPDSNGRSSNFRGTCRIASKSRKPDGRWAVFSCWCRYSSCVPLSATVFGKHFTLITVSVYKWRSSSNWIEVRYGRKARRREVHVEEVVDRLSVDGLLRIPLRLIFSNMCTVRRETLQKQFFKRLETLHYTASTCQLLQTSGKMGN